MNKYLKLPTIYRDVINVDFQEEMALRLPSHRLQWDQTFLICGGFRIFLGGVSTPKVGVFCKFVAEDYMKMKEFGPPGGMRIPNVSLGFANTETSKAVRNSEVPVGLLYYAF